MKTTLILISLVSFIVLSSCSSTQSIVNTASSIIPAESAKALSQTMASKLGLTALQESNTYTTLLKYNTSKNDLLGKLKSNVITKPVYDIAEAKLVTEKNNALKGIMSNNSQLAMLGQLFGIN